MKKIYKSLLFLLIFGVLSLLLLILYCSILPKPLLPVESTIRLFDDEMNVFYTTNSQDSVEWIDYEDIPQAAIDAILSTEDKNFNSHYGVDFLRLGRAAYENIIANDIVQGGSTITQQLAKNLYLSLDQTFARKFEELLYAIQLEMHYTKEDILEAYINTLYYGHGITGMNTAALFFFDKELQDCSVAQITLLVGIPNGPTHYSPFNNYENSKQRQGTVLNLMVDNHVLTREEADSIFLQDLQLCSYTIQIEKNIAGYYQDAVFAQCRELGYCTEDQLSQGIDIYTYYDDHSQSMMQSAIDEHMATSSQQVAMVIIEPYTFAIHAIAGGTHYTETQYNRALYSQRQVGSTLKPLLYYLALEAGLDPSTTFLSSQTSFQLTQAVSYTPQNYMDVYAETDISMIHAISTSDNIYAVKTHLFLGIEMLYEALLSFGIEQTEPTASMALGSTDFPLIDLATIYATFASEGLYIEPSFIKMICDADGNVLYERELNPVQLLNQTETLILTSLLRAPFDIKNNYVSGPSLLGYEPYTTVSAKSGSSDWDSLTVGYNPLMTLAIWTGYDENQAFYDLEERRISRSMFQDIFNMAFPKDEPGPWYQMNSQLEARYVNPITGIADPQGSLYWYKKE